MLQAIGHMSAPLPGDFGPRLEAWYADFGVPTRTEGTALDVDLATARVVYRPVQDGLQIMVRAAYAVQLHQAREAVGFLMAYLLEGAEPEWSGDVQRDTMPPNFHLCNVVSVHRAGPRFLRVTMACDSVEALRVGGMHFTLLLAPAVPVWPRLDHRGKTIWPSGAQALHRAVYTFVSLRDGQFSFDVFEHEGGRVTEWARQVKPGAQVGVTGPGGGDFPGGAHLLIGGDETALPAIRRILATSDPGRRGEAFIEIGDAAMVRDLPKPAGMTLTWLIRGRDRSLETCLEQAVLPSTDRHVWVAGEQGMARRMKALFRSCGLARTEGYFSGYWARP
ncbi:siderophore-interacting protein [Pseudooceanicola sediminis]|uniref:Siderophore-interacting protein n=1 Tax=Pseudooceanicola sediminis TaxID=2211117 RepID=A0A399IXX5_9RHOB|nr:siderophore-interacting protein [Pseudooceanicola sediminis]KAA2311408.1 siderophore-interacting protein [Puniceibacterium sp. HSS470]RII38028.1 siderophore-interacting protein [Pseudooceanicola sediminis]|tara:strand:+ start:8521 stop:9522 length:1002 start_codon:yes stop_codon:yes gene_type:complete